MKVALVFLLWVALWPSMVQAETVFITDRLFISIRDVQGKGSAAVKSIVAGTELEVLQRVDSFVQVREPGGIEGWIADRYLVTASPGIVLLQTTKNRLQLANNKMIKMKQQLTDANKTASVLEARLKSLGVSLQNDIGSGDKRISVETLGAAQGPAGVISMQSGFYFSWLWLLITFAMLVTGFIAGAVWLRELNRKKMGGMYLRI